MECCQGYALIPLDEELPFRQAMRQGRGLEGQVGLLVVGVTSWPGQRPLQAREVTELIAGLGIGKHQLTRDVLTSYHHDLRRVSALRYGEWTPRIPDVRQDAISTRRKGCRIVSGGISGNLGYL